MYDNIVYDIVECENGYLLVGTSEGDGMLCYGYLLFLNHDGNIVWEKTSPDYFPDNYRQYVTAVCSDNHFYIGGTALIDGKKYSVLTKIDLNGNVIFERPFGNAGVLADDNITRKMLLSKQGILLASSGFNNNKTEGQLIQLDFEGNVLWNKFFSYDPSSTKFWEYFEDIQQGKDGNFILKLASNANIIDFQYFSIIKVNPNGEEIWRKTFDTTSHTNITSDNVYFMAVTPYKENHALAYFGTDKIAGDSLSTQGDFAFIEYDEYGNEVNYKRFYNLYEFGVPSMYSNQNDELFLLGSRYRQDKDSNQLSVIKFNADKEKIWERFYFTPNAPIVDTSFNIKSESFKCGLLTKDNGIMMSGDNLYMISNDFYFNSTIIKTDCNGNTVWDYQSCLSPTFEDITIFPNPSSVNFTIQLPNVQTKDNIQLSVYDLTGKLLLSDVYVGNDVININSSAWASGTYICRISVNNEIVKTAKLLKIEGM
ncbi:MAG TPA: T9SS type A sorting domain-containing protein [Crocinitomicaceae bacterium]|nr:T9SS type A sorting domain-containing protein [Crocinitomicaceae bacterium]